MAAKKKNNGNKNKENTFTVLVSNLFLWTWKFITKSILLISLFFVLLVLFIFEKLETQTTFDVWVYDLSPETYKLEEAYSYDENTVRIKASAEGLQSVLAKRIGSRLELRKIYSEHVIVEIKNDCSISVGYVRECEDTNGIKWYVSRPGWSE